MQDIGFESYNSIILLQTVFVVLMTLKLRVILSILLRPCYKYHPKIEQLRNWIKEGLIFNLFLDLYYSTFIDFLMSSFFSIKFGALYWNFKPYKSFFGEILSLISSCFTVFVCCVVIPVCSIYIIFNKKYDIVLEDYIGSLYAGVNLTKGKWARAYSFIGMARRGLLVAVALFNIPVIY